MNRCPVVCLHGWCCEADHFNHQIARFSGERRTISIPWQANLLKHDGRVDLEVAVDLIESACLAEKFDQPPVLVGHSMGGMLAAMIARDLSARQGHRRGRCHMAT